MATHTSIKIQIERVIEQPEFTIAIVSGYPGSLDWSNGQAQTEYSILIETHNHEVFVNKVPPDFDYDKLQRQEISAGTFIGQPIVPLATEKGYEIWRFRGHQAARRPVLLGCGHTRKESFAGNPWSSTQAFRCLSTSIYNCPDDTQMELSPGVGIISYWYHHYGTVADTSLSLVEFHRGVNKPNRPEPSDDPAH